MPVTITLPCEAELVAVVRGVARALFDPVRRGDEAALITSELVTNSVRHSRSRHGGRLTVTFDVGEESGRIEVVDGGPDAEPVPDCDADERGRGLRKIVDAIADKWGQDVENSRRHIWWAELSWS